jgi:hypothetical protein
MQDNLRKTKRSIFWLIITVLLPFGHCIAEPLGKLPRTALACLRPLPFFYGANSPIAYLSQSLSMLIRLISFILMEERVAVHFDRSPRVAVRR